MDEDRRHGLRRRGLLAPAAGATGTLVFANSSRVAVWNRAAGRGIEFDPGDMDSIGGGISAAPDGTLAVMLDGDDQSFPFATFDRAGQRTGLFELRRELAFQTGVLAFDARGTRVAFSVNEIGSAADSTRVDRTIVAQWPSGTLLAELEGWQDPVWAGRPTWWPSPTPAATPSRRTAATWCWKTAAGCSPTTGRPAGVGWRRSASARSSRPASHPTAGRSRCTPSTWPARPRSSSPACRTWCPSCRAARPNSTSASRTRTTAWCPRPTGWPGCPEGARPPDPRQNGMSSSMLSKPVAGFAAAGFCGAGRGAAAGRAAGRLLPPPPSP